MSKPNPELHQLLKWLFEDSLKNLSGLEIGGNIPIREDLLNALLQEYLKDPDLKILNNQSSPDSFKLDENTRKILFNKLRAAKIELREKRAILKFNFLVE